MTKMVALKIIQVIQIFAFNISLILFNNVLYVYVLFYEGIL